MISGMIPIGIRTEEIWSKGAESRDVRQDQMKWCGRKRGAQTRIIVGFPGA